MKKIGIVIIVIVAIVAVLAFTLIGSYNKMVTLQENVDNASANIETSLVALIIESAIVTFASAPPEVPHRLVTETSLENISTSIFFILNQWSSL